MNGTLIVISSPSGCGKDSLINGLMKMPELNLTYSVSATTRLPRGDEQDGVHYYFKTREEFEELIEMDEFLEYTEYCGNYYGTLRRTVLTALEAGKNVVLKIEVEGAANICKQFQERLSIFILPPSLEELKRRLRNRATDGEHAIARRIARAEKELASAGTYNYQIINDDLQVAIEQTAEIIKKYIKIH